MSMLVYQLLWFYSLSYFIKNSKTCFPCVSPYLCVSLLSLQACFYCALCCNVNAFLISPFQLVSNANLELENIRSDLKSKQLELEQATYSVTNLKVCMTSPGLIWHHLGLYDTIKGLYDITRAFFLFLSMNFLWFFWGGAALKILYR